MPFESQKPAEIHDNFGKAYRPAVARPGRAHVPGDDHAHLPYPDRMGGVSARSIRPGVERRGFVALAACLGFPHDLSELVPAPGEEILLLLGSRVTETRRIAFSCSCLDAEGLPPTETRPAWLVASRFYQDRTMPEPGRVHSQICLEGQPWERSSVSEGVPDLRGWWLKQYEQDRNALVAFPDVGTSLAYRHNGCAPGAGGRFRLRSYWGVSLVPLRSFLLGRGYLAPSQAERMRALVDSFKTKRPEEGKS